jgi:hypothetical protein
MIILDWAKRFIAIPFATGPSTVRNMVLMMQPASYLFFSRYTFLVFFVHYLLLLLMCAMNIHTFHCVAASGPKTNNRQLIAMPIDRGAIRRSFISQISRSYYEFEWSSVASHTERSWRKLHGYQLINTSSVYVKTIVTARQELWNEAISSYHSNSLSRVNTLHEIKLCGRSRIRELLCFSVSCLFCEYWY